MNKRKENKTAEISERIAKILQYTGDTRNGFAIKLGYERAQTVYDVINMKSAPSYDFFRRFSVSEYSDIIDLKWLLSGEGTMLRSDGAPSISATIATDAFDKGTVYSDAVTLRLMKKIDEKDAQIDELQSELRRQSAELAALKALWNKEKDYQFGGIVDTFVAEPSSDYGGGFSNTNPPPVSKKSSAGKMHK
ncbi:hypothetical protein [Bacteroides heparinolyticus]|uniref:hypothetical protein n=1 Tax=Prevotella heparinolytica TaxID=28113 RepID=UPI0023F16928|nr:hypothetical protein [Bacteroides heparinolyticus]